MNACNRKSAYQKRNICIPKKICNLRSKQIKRCSQSATYSCLIKQNIKRSSIKMSSNNSPEKSDPKPSTIINTSTQSGNINLNVVLNRVPSQPPSLSSDSDIEVIPPEKLQPRANASKKFITIFSFPGQYPVFPTPL